MLLRVSNKYLSKKIKLLKVGKVFTFAFSILKKKPVFGWVKKSLLKTRYIWSIVYFSGLCLKFYKNSNILELKNYYGLCGFSFKVFLGAPNILGFYRWSRCLVCSRKSLISLSENYKIIADKSSLL